MGDTPKTPGRGRLPSALPLPTLAVTVATEGRVVVITLDLRDSDGILGTDDGAALAAACESVANDGAALALVLMGVPGTFCSGETEATERGFLGQLDSPGAAAVRALAASPAPVIAAIDGPVSGLGVELALACDLRIASDRSTFAMPALLKGVLPFAGGTQRLPRVVGRAHALELLLLGDTIDAAEAHRIGLVNRVFPAGDVHGKALMLAGRLCEKAPIATRYLREAVQKGMDLTLDQGLRLEADLYFLIQTTADRTEGIRSFLERRKPEFRGE